MKILKSIFAILVIGALCWFVWSKLQGNQQEKAKMERLAAQITDTIPVEIAIATKRSLDEKNGVVGHLYPDKLVYLIADTQGKVDKLFKRKGDYVKKGEVIAKVDDTILQDNLKLAQGALAKLEKDKARLDNLLSAEAVTERQVEEVVLGIEKTKTTIVTLEEQIKNTNLKSPMSGVITRLLMEDGTFVAGGMNVAEILDANKLKMVARVSEEIVVQIKEGQKIAVRMEVFPNETFEGFIKLIATRPDFGGKYQIDVSIKNPKNIPLKVGMFGYLQFSEGAKETILIPRKSIVGSIQAPKVYTINDGIAIQKKIEVGFSDSKVAEVLSGLSEGEQVVINGQINLNDGTKVEIRN